MNEADAAAIQGLIEIWAATIRTKNMDIVMSSYSPDIVSFDVEAIAVQGPSITTSLQVAI